MHFLAAVVLFPVLFWLLSAGCGLLVERLTGAALPAALLLPLGFATLIVVSQFTEWYGATAPLTPWALLALALAGAALARPRLVDRWRARGRYWWVILAPALLSYLLVGAPVLAAGRLTFAGYLLDTTGAIQTAGAQWLLHHGHSFPTGDSVYARTLWAYFANSYPFGAHSVLGPLGWLTGQRLIWLYTIFQALELGMVALVLVFLAQRAGLSRWAACVTGTVASVPALVYAYALMGSIKELTALPALVLLGALVVCARELRAAAGVRAVLPFAVAGAGALGAIGIAASPWVALFGTGALIAALPPLWPAALPRRVELGRFAAGGLALVGATALAGLPTVGPLSKTLALAEGVSNSDPKAVADPGNLLRPLKFVQAFGVWLGESHRLEPRYLNETYALLGLAIFCCALGVIWLVRRRAWSVLFFVGGSLVVWDFLHHHATTWTDAKLLVIVSPVFVFLALVGALGLMRARRWEGALLAIALSAGVLASDGLLYHATNLAPTQRFSELAAIGARFEGQGPTLVPQFDEYILPQLEGMQVDSPGMAYSGPFSFVGGAVKAYGHSYDLDSIALASVERFRTIVMLRSPLESRPPYNFRHVWTGSYYTVWRRQGPAPRVHVGLGGGLQASAVPACRSLRALARRAQRSAGRIDFAERALNVSANLPASARTSLVGIAPGGPAGQQLVFVGPGRVQGVLDVKTAGESRLWLQGDVDRALHVLIDGHEVGAPSAQSGDEGTVIDVGTVKLAAGRHSFELLRGGGDLRPDDAGSTVIGAVILEPLGAEGEQVASVASSNWRALCGRPLDWVEIV